MRRVLAVSLLLVGLCVSALADPGRTAAQATSADSASVLLQAAAHFESQERPEVAEAIYQLIVQRYPDSRAALRARERLTALEAGARRGAPGKGRVELQVWTTTYGLWLGIAVPGALGAEDPEPYGVGLLLGGPAGYLTGKALARSRPLTEGQARAITLGGTWGTWQGLGWVKVMDLGTQQSACYALPDGSPSAGCFDTSDDSQATFAGMVVGGVLGIVAGTALSRRDISPGVATAVNFGALWGTWLGFAGGYLADLDGDGLLATTLLGGDAGLLGTALMAPRWNPSRSRARIVSIYGVVGALSGLGLDLLIQPDDDKVVVALPLAGSLVGLALGAGSTRGYDAPGAGREDTPTLPSGAFLSLRGGVWTVDAPVPYPVMVERPGPTGVSRRAALGVTLLSAKLGGRR